MGPISTQKDVCFVPKLCPDVLVQILCRLPEKDLIQYKCVSKDWYFLISDTCVPIVSAKTSLCGLYFHTLALSDDMSRLHRNSSYDAKNRYFAELSKSGDRQVLEYVSLESGGDEIGEVEIDKHAKNLLDSCNGLLLLRKPSTRQYDVFNPTTKESVTIPYSCDSYCDAALAFDPCKSIHFKVICIPYFHLDAPKWLDMFSSETEKWVRHTLHFDPVYIDGSHIIKEFVYLDGMLYWVLASKNLFCIDLNLVSAHAIDLPKIERSSLSSSIGVSVGHLCFAQCERSNVSIWLLEDNKQADGWILKHSIRLDYLLDSLMVAQFRLLDEIFWFQPYAIHPKSDVIFLGTARSIISWHIKSNKFNLVSKTREGMVVPGCFTPVLTYSRCLVPLKSLGMRNFRSNQFAMNSGDTKVFEPGNAV
uniref:F-box protein n=2 Tax=Quercus lobata TaxID=97700 RepID=A0A7N2LEM2_QUELO